jgi:hypothetical protein
MNSDCPSQILDDTNQKIYNRNIPSHPLQPYLNVRPVMTKYSYLPIVDPRREINTAFIDLPTYNTTTTFNPGNRVSPWSGFSSNVNTESELRNQIYAIQKCSQSVYVPNSNSDLYQYKFSNPAVEMGERNLLFKEESFEHFNPNPDEKILGVNLFNNNTRVQLKDINCG